MICYLNKDLQTKLRVSGQWKFIGHWILTKLFLYLAIPILGIMSYTYEKTNQTTLWGMLSITKKREHVRIGDYPLPLSWEPLFMKKLWSHKKIAVCVVLWLVNGENYFTKSHRHRSETSRQLLKDTESSIWLFLGQKCESESTLSSVDWLPQTLAHAGICSCKAVAGFRQLTFPKMHWSFN